MYDENNTLICEDKPPQPENCSIKGILDNKCFEEISDEKIKDVYSYIKSKSFAEKPIISELFSPGQMK